MKNSANRLIKILGILCILGAVLFAGYRMSHSPDSKPNEKSISVPSPDNAPTRKRILFVHSYDQGYPWTSGILAGAIKTLELSPQPEEYFWGNSKIILQNFFMDTKRNATEEHKKLAANRAKELIESWHPDVVMTSDDNAVKYLVVPILDQSTLPFVYCGVNWDASEYKLPSSRVTGMIEVQPIDQILAFLQPFARGTKVGFLKGKDLSAVKEADAFENFTGKSLKRHLVTNFAEWQQAYRELQQEVDILLVGNAASIRGWDPIAAKQLVTTATQIPTGTWDAWMREFSLVTFSTVPEEQGEWVASAALSILAGESPEKIVPTHNQKVKIHRNMAIAKQLGIIFPMDFIRRSWAVKQELPE